MNSLEKAAEADGFVFGTPVYYAHPSGRLLSFLDRAFYASSGQFALCGQAGRGGGVRTAGGDHRLPGRSEQIFRHYLHAVVSGTYWNMVHGRSPEEVAPGPGGPPDHAQHRPEHGVE